METPRSRSSVTPQLELIQRRCADLLEESPETDDPALVEPDDSPGSNNDHFRRA